MIRSAWRRIVRFLGSAGFATSLLAIVGVWSVLATVVPQGAASDPKVKAWASAYPLLESAAFALGLHRAFSAPFFTLCVALLALSTAICAWQRTKAASARMRALRRAEAADAQAVAGSHDFAVAFGPELGDPEVLTIASETLARVGIKTKRREDLLTAVSPAWSVWGSPIFHWALLVLILGLLVGNLQRSEGLMGVAVGQAKLDAAQAYGSLHTGPLHDWRRIHRSIRVDAFDIDYKTGGVDRGPTPTVSVLDASGAVIKTQRVYPNMTLKTGSLTVYPSAFGLSANVSLLNTAGVVTGRSAQLVDFSAEATGGTVPTDLLNVSDQAGNPLLGLAISVPLDRVDGVLRGRLPKSPTARVVVASADRTVLIDQILRPGEELGLPDGSRLRLDGIDYYARLQVVDDGSIPLLFVGLIVAMVGLTIAVVARQQIILATVVEDADGRKLAVQLRLWRNAASSRGEIQSELAHALNGGEKESME